MAVGTGGAVRTRRDVYKLPADDQTLEWYGKAVTELKTRPIGDPTSWRYQAAVHDYTRADDPLAQPDDQLPVDQNRFWAKCQHGCSFFLPWHRIYLFYFEQLIADTIVNKLNGPAGWSLPYWNYSDTANQNAAVLPPAFRDQNSPLFVAERDPDINGGAAMNELFVDISCLREHQYYGGGNGETGGFGGQQVHVPVHSGRQTWVGGLENTPHGQVHTAVGGNGWMSSFDTAALDPIFWLHHANIDRLWEVWRQRDDGHINPSDTNWLNQRFEFHDSAGNLAAMAAKDVVDTTADPLRYQYEDTSDPFPGV